MYIVKTRYTTVALFLKYFSFLLAQKRTPVPNMTGVLLLYMEFCYHRMPAADLNNKVQASPFSISFNANAFKTGMTAYISSFI